MAKHLNFSDKFFTSENAITYLSPIDTRSLVMLYLNGRLTSILFPGDDVRKGQTGNGALLVKNGIITKSGFCPR